MPDYKRTEVYDKSGSEEKDKSILGLELTNDTISLFDSSIAAFLSIIILSLSYCLFPLLDCQSILAFEGIDLY